MYFNTSVLSAILMGSALVAAIPRGIVERAPVSEVNVVFSRDLSMAEDMQPNNDFAEEAFKKCGELGIDPYGDMPTDYFKTDGKSYHFKEDSKGVLWIAAQSSLSFDAGKIRRRELTGYSFATWTNSRGCTGNAVFYPEVYFNKYYWDQFNNYDMNSFQFIKGELDAGFRSVQLQHWRGGGSQVCDPINHRVNGKANSCVKDLPTFTCFRVESG